MGGMSKTPSVIPLSPEKKLELWDQHDQTVREGMATFVKVGVALRAIQVHELFTGEFKSFSDYCAQRLNMSKSQGYRLMDAVDVFENIKGIAAIDPISESQIRSLKNLKPANQKKAWKQAVAEMGGKKKLPAIQVRRAAEILEPKHFKKADPKAKVAAQSVAIDDGKEELWADLERAIQTKSKGKALRLIKQLKG